MRRVDTVGLGALVKIERAFAGEQATQVGDSHSPGGEMAGHGLRRSPVAIKCLAQTARRRCVTRVHPGRLDRGVTRRKHPLEQIRDTAAVDRRFIPQCLTVVPETIAARLGKDGFETLFHIFRPIIPDAISP